MKRKSLNLKGKKRSLKVKASSLSKGKKSKSLKVKAPLLRDKYGRFLPRTKKAQKLAVRLPPQRDEKGRFIKGRVAARTKEERAEVRKVLRTMALVEERLKERFVKERIKRAFVQASKVEAIHEAKQGLPAFIERMKRRSELAKEITEVMQYDPQSVKEYTREELIEAFGDFYELDPNEWFDLVVYGGA